MPPPLTNGLVINVAVRWVRPAFVLVSARWAEQLGWECAAGAMTTRHVAGDGR